MAYAKIDLGEGLGHYIHLAHFSNLTYNDLKTAFKLRAPMMFDVVLPYTYVVEDQPQQTPYLKDTCEPIVRLTPFIDGSYVDTSKWEGKVHLVYGKGFSKKRPNQRSYMTYSGVTVTFDANLTIGYGELTMKNLSYEKGKELMDWIINKTVFNLHPFKIEVVV